MDRLPRAAKIATARNVTEGNPAGPSVSEAAEAAKPGPTVAQATAGPAGADYGSAFQVTFRYQR
jgi:hypothetical protein